MKTEDFHAYSDAFEEIIRIKHGFFVRSCSEDCHKREHQPTVHVMKLTDDFRVGLCTGKNLTIRYVSQYRAYFSIYCNILLQY